VLSIGIQYRRFLRLVFQLLSLIVGGDDNHEYANKNNDTLSVMNNHKLRDTRE
jgi:hypothetical protein